MYKLKKLPKEWLLLIIVGILVIIIGIFQWNQTTPKTLSARWQADPDVTSGEAMTPFRVNLQGEPPTVKESSNRFENEEGNVTVAVEYLKDKSQGNNMVFEIALDTHSVNLDAFDFWKDVTLTKDGKSNLPKTVNQSGGGHHRKAEVTFSRVAAPLTVVVMNVSNIARREFQFTNLN